MALASFCTSTKLHYSQTSDTALYRATVFCTSTKLHYSQTWARTFADLLPFCTSTKLHYSQTLRLNNGTPLRFCTSTKLHYSQTGTEFASYAGSFVPLRNYTTLKRCWWWPRPLDVLYLYEITLLSNVNYAHTDTSVVLYLYEITLLSNFIQPLNCKGLVLYLYEITLLSNLKPQIRLHFCVDTQKKRLRAAGGKFDTV